MHKYENVYIKGWQFPGQ